jgi:hypothetical protein
MREKLKSWLQEDHIYYGLLLLLVGTGSFLLGQASVSREGLGEPLVIAQKPVIVGDVEKESSLRVENTTTAVVASKSGTKYHLKTCPGAKTIKPENLIEFASVAAAEAAGYKRAQNCP